MSSAVKRAAVAAFLAVSACTSESADDDRPPPPEPETLFETLPAATPDKLRGVWQSMQEQPNGTLELRLRFTEGYLVGAAKCVPKDSDRSAIAGGSTGLQTTALDAATGKVTFATLGFQKEENGILCSATLPGEAYEFTITSGELTLEVPGKGRLANTFTKIGD